MGKPTGQHREETIVVTFHRHRESLSNQKALDKIERWVARQIVRGFNRLNIHVESVQMFGTYYYDHGEYLGDQFDRWMDGDI